MASVQVDIHRGLPSSTRPSLAQQAFEVEQACAQASWAEELGQELEQACARAGLACSPLSLAVLASWHDHLALVDMEQA